jgi:hypothetical protein
MSKQKECLVGRRFGRLLVTSLFGKTDGYNYRWNCLCDCGKTSIVQAGTLKNGRTKSCGCLTIEKSIVRLLTHGQSGRNSSPEYRSWYAMIQRCTNPNNDRYKNYGGRGIIVCKRWLNSFENFFNDMGQKPSSSHTIDRFPNINGNYKPTNCRWGTPEQQYRGKTNNRWVVLFGEKMIISDFCRKVSKPLSAVNFHLNRGKSIDEVFLFYKNKQVNG